MMTLQDLKEMIEQLEAEGIDMDVEVRIGSQKEYPFEYEISHDILGDNLDSPDYQDKVYLLEGEQIGYFTKDAWN